MKTHKAEREYRIREKEYTEQYEKENQRYNLLSNLRLAAFIAIIGGAALYYSGYRFSGGMIFSASLLSFILFVVRHGKVKRRREQAFSLAGVNRRSLARITGKWVEFTDRGEEYIDPEHPFGTDLDIFGQASMFQWINNTFTFLGREFLKNTLTRPLKDEVIIKERQAALGELSEKLDWRQQFQADSSALENARNAPDSLFKWAENENHTFRRPWMRRIISLLTSVTVLSVFLAYLYYRDFFYLTGMLLLIQLTLFIVGLRYYSNAYEVAGLHKDSIAIFQKLLAAIEKEKFEAKYLIDLRAGLIDSKGSFASKQISELAFIVEMMSFKNNPLLYFLFNVFFLWDYHCMLLLEGWKKKSGRSLRTWLTTIGSFEELSSLAAIRYDNPEWGMPQLTHERQYLSARGMGHPLLPAESRVCNDLDIKGPGNVLLITGSNMSGKSTLLRTVGLNMLLALTGSPVCAGEFKCSIMDVYTSMRVNDNLEKKISSFYAELLRIKTIIEAASEDNSVLFLLDELFRGTNTKDRHTGAKAVLRKLSKLGAAGLVSTHDLELGELEKDEEVKVKNYHFIEAYENRQLIFDYKLRPGISKTANAIYLMKMVGIDEL